MTKFFLSLSILFFTSICFAQSIPSLINYQGKLADAAGQPVSGQKSITFTLYDDSATGNVLWTETQLVQIAGGQFNVLLGSSNPVTEAIFNTPDVFLGLKVDSGIEMSPRSRIASVGYAFKAADSDKVDGLHANEIGGAGSNNTPWRKKINTSPAGCTLVETVPSGQVLFISDIRGGNSTATYIYDDAACTNSLYLFPNPSKPTNAGYTPPLPAPVPFAGPVTLYINSGTYVMDYFFYGYIQ